MFRSMPLEMLMKSSLMALVAVACQFGAALVGVDFAISTAKAQDPPVVINPGEPQAPAPAPAPQPAPQPEPVIIQVPTQGDVDIPLEDDGSFIYRDDIDDGDRRFFGDGRGSGNLFGPVPPSHVVRRGDTLWDICWFYFNNPFEWPKIWAYNPSITNPHWIFPGDQVRLYPQGLATVSPDSLDPDAAPESVDIQPTPARQTNVSLRQIAFVDRDNLEFAATVVGAVEERTLLSLGDSIYLEYNSELPPTVGKRYAVYTDTTPVTHPDTGKTVGAYVRILGELEVVTVKKDKRARAIITDSVDIIERGAKVGPLQRTFRTVEPRRNKKELQGTIVAMLGTDQIIGQGQLVFVDKGKNDGVEVGNRMFVVRRGDALETIMKPESNVGKDDRRFPSHAVGEVIVVQTGKKASVALVTLALRAIGVGDKVLMRKARE